MQYMLIHAGAPGLDDEWNEEAWAALNAWLDDAIGSGVSIEGGPLRLDADATTVKVQDGQLIVTDGPYAVPAVVEPAPKLRSHAMVPGAMRVQGPTWMTAWAPSVRQPGAVASRRASRSGGTPTAT
ncbi:MAG: YciI family protein, partial [Trebonia sp.]